MKTTTPPSRLNNLCFGHDAGLQNVRLIKAGQADKFLHSRNNGHAPAAKTAPHSPVIRLVGTSADYCDLEVVCGCGETMQVRCWNAPSSEPQTLNGKE